MKLSTSHFASFHAAVHGGKEPFAWQQRLLEEVVGERTWPRVLDLPTGAGKTTCLDIALFALALDASEKPVDRWCPRRIAMVVDRRTVVDQAAERGRVLLDALTTSGDAIVQEVGRRLRALAGEGEEPLAVYTLRGGVPKDDGWARSPAQPLILASTVDQIGSRMFMQGYGVSAGMKPLHAGLLSNDTLLLLDEVHLSEPFRQTLDQIARLRARFAGSGLKSRFFHVFLSATPGSRKGKPFALRKQEMEPRSPLGRRLHARKPAQLVEVEDRPALEKACVDRAKDFLERHRTIGVIVNRLKSASNIARELREALGSRATVTLLTGRMRPLDRDDVLCELKPAVRSGRERSDDSPRRVIVATQCLEVGADFDFDALVTEAASLDALRQRFGRVDRLGNYGKAEGVIVWDSCAKLKEESRRRGEKPSIDPIYGEALENTAKWLKKQAARSRSTIDFGVLALPVPKGDELSNLLAPKADAPTLLPAYLDLWAQTSPAPAVVPDVSLWLHGPMAGPADVHVVWRADLTEDILDRGDVETAIAVVGAIRPSSLEAMTLPFVTVRAWLGNRAELEVGDTEGEARQLEVGPEAAGRPALRWRGGESEIVHARSASGPSLEPGDTIVVPASYGGIRDGCFDPTSTDPVQDRAEQAEFFARAKPVLRLHPVVLEQLGLSLPLDDVEGARAALAMYASNDEWPAWRRLWAERLALGSGEFVIPGDPSWTVIGARRLGPAELREALRGGPERTIEHGIELTTDSEDSFHAGRAVSLADHSADVESVARDYATRCGLDPWLAEHVAMAAWLHDIGKADRRFQVMLRGGSEIELFKDETPWAKSKMAPGARAAHRLARQKSGYPRGARHEVQSLAMLEGCKEGLEGRLAKRLKEVGVRRKPDLDLVFHLVSSHHGYCRPFAPVVVDETPVDVRLEGHASRQFGSVDFPVTSSCHSLHRLDSAFADRFWALVEKYGWQELCWLEAILRLADHRASELEQTRP